MARTDSLMHHILTSTESTEYVSYLSGGINYRLTHNPKYKANREDFVKPILYEDIRQYLIDSWRSEVTDGNEADDAMSIRQMQGKGDTIVCSIDKDLLQIPGNHFNFVKNEFTIVTPMEGLQFFYRQLLIGDNVDNIFGIYGIGPKKAEKIVNGCEDELEMFERIQNLYGDDERLLMNGRCLWLQRFPDQLWEFPDGSTKYEEFTEEDSESIYLSVQK